MALFQFKLLGGTVFQRASGTRVEITIKKAQALLAYLALHPGQGVPRDKLASLLWSDRGDAQAHGSLRQTLTVLRKAFEPTGSSPLIVENGEVSLDLESTEVDALAFAELCERGGIKDLEAAARLYRGDLLDGFALRDPAFEEWLETARRDYREIAISAFTRLLAHMTASGALEEGIALGQRLLRLNPLQENVHRTLMRLHAERGQPNTALSHFEDCRQLLEDELAVPPDADTLRLANEIRHLRRKTQRSTRFEIKKIVRRGRKIEWRRPAMALAAATVIAAVGVTAWQPWQTDLEAASVIEDGRAMEHARSSRTEAHTAFRAAWEHYLGQTATDFAKAIPYMETAVRLDPNYGRAHAALAILYQNVCALKLEEQVGKSCNEAYLLADQHLQKAESLPTSLGNAAISKIHLKRGQHDDALAAAARALALGPNDPEAHLAMAWALITTGRPEDGIVSIEAAMRLEPRRPSHYAQALGVAHFAAGRPKEAAHILANALQRNPSAIMLAPPLAAAYVRLGLRNEARSAMGRLAKTATGWRPGQSIVWDSLPYRWAIDYGGVEDQLIDGVDFALLPRDQTLKTLAIEMIHGPTQGRGIAMRKVGLFGASAKDTVPYLIEVLKDESDEQRWCAIVTLGRIGPAARSSIPVLKEAREVYSLRYVAEAALKKIISH